MGPYIVDFACLEKNLVVELDGSQHNETEDASRTRDIEAMGYRVLRFWNNDALIQQQVVLAVILEALDSVHQDSTEGRSP